MKKTSNKRTIAVILENIRSVHNVGSILRTCDGFNISGVYCIGYTPYPELEKDIRLPHIRKKVTDGIHKTALGAETELQITSYERMGDSIEALKQQGYYIVAIEQDSKATSLETAKLPDKIAVVVGNERDGITEETLALCDSIWEIPMYGHKESFNVSVATGIVLHWLRSVT